AGWSGSCVSAVDSNGRTILIVDVHRDDGKRFVVRADEKLTAFIQLDKYARHNNQESRRDGTLHWSFQRGQDFFLAGKSLGLSKLGTNAIRMPPHWGHYPEHDHAVDNEEELYIPLEGSGTLHAEGQTYPMHRGILIRGGAATKREIVPGPEGMTL